MQKKIEIKYLSQLIFLNMEIRILELRENGLIDHWDSWFRPVPPRCNHNLRSDYKPPKRGNKISPIPLKNLFGALMILVVGCILGFSSRENTVLVGYRKTRRNSSARLLIGNLFGNRRINHINNKFKHRQTSNYTQ